MYYSDTVEVRTSVFGGKGLFTTSDCKAGQIILRVPKKYFIDYDYLVQKYPRVVGKINNKRVQFAYCLCLEIQNIDSYHRKYFESIPINYDNPITKDVKFYVQFQNQAFADRLKVKKERIIKEIEILMATSEQPPLLENVLRSFAIVQSRTLYYPTEMDPKSEVGVLVPLYDMANHSQRVNSCNIYSLFYYDKDREQYIMKAYKDYIKGEEVLISYGSYNNQHFIQYYGFVPQNNPNILQVPLWWKDIIKDALTYEQLTLISVSYPQQVIQNPKLKLKQQMVIHIDRLGQILQNGILKLLCVKGFHVKSKSVKEINSAFSKLGGDFYILEQYRSILCKLQEMMFLRFSTTLQEDKQLLNNIDYSFIRTWIFYRILCKQQISNIMTANTD